jgi:putative protease
MVTPRGRGIRPEVLAPAGSPEALRAALASGADAVYFGLDQGFNARARATNFDLASLPETVASIHRAGARAYLTLNTLVFEPELPAVEEILRQVARAGVDAIILQDPAVALLAARVCPQLELHASTQMTVSSAEGARFAGGLGCTRVVVPRELSVDEIRQLRAGTELELEVFVHGALCVSWSGQCLSSEAWGGRSANRGQCAQACRMPYDLIVDGQRRELGEVRYLLSPADLAGLGKIGELAEIGVHGLKIEGRQKGPEYVAAAVSAYRRTVDEGGGRGADPGVMRELALTYSRGLSSGFFDGSDHQTLVSGTFPRHRGLPLGEVVAIEGRDVVLRPAPEEARLGLVPHPGLGVAFEDGDPEAKSEPGGPLYRFERRPGPGAELWVLGFGQVGPDLARVRLGRRAFATGDAAIAGRTERLLREEAPAGRVPVTLEVRGSAGQPLQAVARVELPGQVLSAEAQSAAPLLPARGQGLDAGLLAAKLGAFGGTPLRLERVDAGQLADGLHLPVSQLKEMRRQLVEVLLPGVERGAARAIHDGPVLPGLRQALAEAPLPARAGAIPERPQLIPLCRTLEQLEAVIALRAGAAAGTTASRTDEVELDFMEMVGLGQAVARARQAGLRVVLATVRVQKPGEEGYDVRLARLSPDGVLVRHWGALMTFAPTFAPGGAGAERPARPLVHGDFSLNVTNGLSTQHLFGLGADTLTAAHDLDAEQLLALLDASPPGRIAVTVHHHIPTFHTEHCVYAHLLSQGRDFRTCGRPCESHAVSLADHLGLQHPVIVDVGCRNTVFNAQAQSAAFLVPALLERGVRRLRLEFVRESALDTGRVLTAYGELVDGTLTTAELRRRLGIHEQFGVTRGTMTLLAPQARPPDAP